jgi:hypothetical protein
MTELDRLLSEQGHRYPDGALVIAMRETALGGWLPVVVSKELQPLLLWGDEQPGFTQDALRGNDGRILYVLASTPPGVRTPGLLRVPVDKRLRPLHRLMATVTATGSTMLDDPDSMEAQGTGADPWHSIGSVLDFAATTARGEIHIQAVESAEGDLTEIVLAGDGHPLLFFVDMQQLKAQPGSSFPQLTLMVMVVSSEEDRPGLVAMASDPDLRPLYSSRWLNERLGQRERGKDTQETSAPHTAMQTSPETIVPRLEVVEAIRKLAELRDSGILSEEEFSTKKQQLLDRI